MAGPDTSGSLDHRVANHGHTKKRKRKSRKGLEKKFTCAIDGCGKVYSRAEHLQRHQLNHSSPETFRCTYPDCSRTFVRPDLLRRHLDRHVAKGPHLHERRTNAAASVSPQSAPRTVASSSPPGAAPSYLHQAQPSPHKNVYAINNANIRQLGNMAIGSHMPPTRIRTTNGPLPLQNTPNSSGQIDMGFDFSTAKYAQSSGLQNGSQEPQHVANQMDVLDPLSVGDAGPVFGADAPLDKSPSGAMPEDFMAYLFDSTADNSRAAGMLPQSSMNYGDLNNSQYPNNDFSLANQTAPVQQIGPQQIMSVYNLLEPNMPEASMSDNRSEELFNFIKDRFHGHEHAALQHTRDSVLCGDRSRSDHVLSKRMMQAYIGSFWKHFSAQMPIIHKPTFSADETPTILLLAIMSIGAACLEKSRRTDVTLAAVRLADFIITHLRWEVFMDDEFRPPAKLWVFQALILVELYEKMSSTRELHERAHIHHATTITLMRRGRSLIGKSAFESPMYADASSVTKSAEERWKQWIENESTRRVACGAFMIDSVHTTMFGHSAVMATHEMRLPLPCEDALWMAANVAEHTRIEKNLAAQGVKPVSFLEGLKLIINKKGVQTSLFARAALMAGLLSVKYHLTQRGLQVNVLGGSPAPVAGGRDKWRVAMTRAYDSWKADFDRSLGGKDLLRDPYGKDDVGAEMYNMYMRRTVLHNLAHMAMHADIIDCQIFARAKRLLGRPVGPGEFSATQQRIHEDWAPSAQGRDAAFYALKLLRFVLTPDQIERNEDVPVLRAQGGKLYEAGCDMLLNRPWAVYFAGLVIWTYGYATEGPSLAYVEPATPRERWAQMRSYLSVYAGISGPEELKRMRGVNSNISLLMVLRDSLCRARWELLQEGGRLMQNCIALSQGQVIA